MRTRWLLIPAAVLLAWAVAVASVSLPWPAHGQEAECVTGSSISAKIADNLDIIRADRLLGAEARDFLTNTGAPDEFSSVTVRADIVRVTLYGDDYALVVASDARGCWVTTGTLEWETAAPLLPVGA